VATLVAPPATPTAARPQPPIGSTPLDPMPLARTVAGDPSASSPATVVVVSGHPAARLARATALAAAGVRVVAVGTIAAARHALTAGPACLVLDRRAPDGDALALVDELDRSERAPRMVVVTAAGSDRERVECLVAGADDAVLPDVPVTELVARVQRLVAPGPVAARSRPNRIAVGRVSIDQDRRSVSVDGDEVALSPTQYQILVSLAVEGGRAVTVRALVEQCWDRHQDQSSCAVRTQVTRLRRALQGAIEIRCVRGEGYRLAEAEG
jgi:two-component system OmpR family response regulator